MSPTEQTASKTKKRKMRYQSKRPFSCWKCHKKFVWPAHVEQHYVRLPGHRPPGRLTNGKLNGLPTKAGHNPQANAPMLRFCFACGTRVAPTWSFCGGCGRNLSKTR